MNSNTDQNLESIWDKHYQITDSALQALSHIPGVLTAFNTNIDAVKRIDLKQFENGLKEFFPDGIPDLLPSEIRNFPDLLRGLFFCFEKGAAAEWIIQTPAIYEEIKQKIGYDHLQMGGQAGIIANLMGVLGIPCYVHAASLAKEQTQQFLPSQKLFSASDSGKWKQASQCSRDQDPPLIHWILEFKTGDQINWQNQTWTCPKSNRFIATYDPYNFQLKMDSSFLQSMQQNPPALSHMILSGFQMLSSQKIENKTGQELIDLAWDQAQKWKTPNSQIHLEMASTQDAQILKHLAQKIAPHCDSLGFNEQELMDLCQALDPTLQLDRKKCNAHHLFALLIPLFQKIPVPRMQLHLFGLYITLINNKNKIDPYQVRRGMLLAAHLAAAKAGTAQLEKSENLNFAKNLNVTAHSFQELKNLDGALQHFPGKNQILAEGIFTHSDWTLVAVPSKIVENPKSLVGMGDTISSLSLIGSY